MMKRTLFTIGALLAASIASAKGSDTILKHDPNGVYVTIISVATVLVVLIVLCLLIFMFAKIMVRSARKKEAASKGLAPGEAMCDSVVNGEVITAIAVAIKLYSNEMHDKESDVITINKVARVYSPWSSKIHGLTQMPQKNR